MTRREKSIQFILDHKEEAISKGYDFPTQDINEATDLEISHFETDLFIYLAEEELGLPH
jgi:hypothetical protein